MDSIKIEKEINEIIDKQLPESNKITNQGQALDCNNGNELMQKLNRDSKERLYKEHTIEDIAKAATNYILSTNKMNRKPVEDINQSNCFYQNGIKRVTGLLNAFKDEDWMYLELLYAFYSM